jgi:hypothetical protein
LLVQVQLFPYNYAYASPQTDLIGKQTENDFWRTSFRELLPDVPAGEFVMCSPFTSDDGVTMRYTTITGRPPAEASTDCRLDPISPLTPYLGSVSADDHAVAKTFIALVERGKSPGSNCETLAQVTRRRYFTRQVMSTVARCRLVLDPYPSTGIAFGEDGSGANYLLGGWTSSHSAEGVRLVGASGSLGLELPEAWATAPLSIRLTGEASAISEMRVNNEAVSATSTATGWDLHVPADTVGAMGERRLVITVGSPDVGRVVLTRAVVSPSRG